MRLYFLAFLKLTMLSRRMSKALQVIPRYIWREFHFFLGDHLLTDFLLIRSSPCRITDHFQEFCQVCCCSKIVGCPFMAFCKCPYNDLLWYCQYIIFLLFAVVLASTFYPMLSFSLSFTAVLLRHFSSLCQGQPEFS